MKGSRQVLLLLQGAWPGHGGSGRWLLLRGGSRLHWRRERPLRALPCGLDLGLGGLELGWAVRVGGVLVWVVAGVVQLSVAGGDVLLVASDAPAVLEVMDGRLG